MQNYTEELLKEEKEEMETAVKQTECNDYIDHEEVLDIFLKWDRSF